MLRTLVAAAALLGCAACTVDLGAVPDAGACPASPDFFVSDVYPRYLVPNQCGNSGCHAFNGGHGTLRLRPPETPPAQGTALVDFPTAWRENYLSALQLIRCDQPSLSRLLTVPEGQGNLHPPGPVVLDRNTAALVITRWATP
jgi:hypothetical protein